MGYACPVCEAPQVDAAHLANHLAFTAMIHGDDHADWLDERVPDWRSMDPETLGPRVADHAEERDVDAPEGDAGRSSARRERPTSDTQHLSADQREIVAEAREMTRKMYDADDGESE
ncbi:MAG: DUF5810 domain-containing protein [Halanaeroarchaeum sp.]